MREVSVGDGAADLPTTRTAESVLADALSEPVTDVVWCARRRLPPDDLDVVVYRGAVDDDPYYAVLGPGICRTVPAGEFDSPGALIAAVQAARHQD